MAKTTKAQYVGWVLIIAGIIVFVGIALHYYDTPFGYGNQDGLMVSLFAPIGAVPLAIGVLVLAIHRFRSKRG